MKLVIGNKNYSSWSLRPWLLLSAFKVQFEEVQESLAQHDIKQRLAKYSPACKVPVLLDADLTVWDSLAICEYVSERYLHTQGWPSDQQCRAQARAICSEMHAGFTALRAELPMNCRATRKVNISAAALADISRIDAIWSHFSQQNTPPGPWLFGAFSIADCFFAPVALRFSTYAVPLTAPAQAYAARLIHHESVASWVASAKTETEVIAEDEAGEAR